jgi:hypothetical protein
MSSIYVPYPNSPRSGWNLFTWENNWLLPSKTIHPGSGWSETVQISFTWGNASLASNQFSAVFNNPHAKPVCWRFLQRKLFPGILFMVWQQHSTNTHSISQLEPFQVMVILESMRFPKLSRLKYKWRHQRASWHCNHHHMWWVLPSWLTISTCACQLVGQY